ncbi:MAG: hypothetical protein WD048_12015 [Chitinophagales bacterium]
MESRIHKGKGFTETYLSRLFVLIIVFFAGCNNTAENYDCFQSRSNTYLVEDFESADSSFLLVQMDDFVFDTVYGCQCLVDKEYAKSKAYLYIGGSYREITNYRYQSHTLLILIENDSAKLKLNRNSDLPFKSSYYLEADVTLNSGAPFTKGSLKGRFNAEMTCVDSLIVNPEYTLKVQGTFNCRFIETTEGLPDTI